MSFHVFFGFSVGLSSSLFVPAGTFDSLVEHVFSIESALGLKTTQFLDNPPHWEGRVPTRKITNEAYCKAVEEHNAWVRRLWKQFGEWSKTP